MKCAGQSALGINILLFLMILTLFLSLNGSSIFDGLIQEDWFLLRNYTISELVNTLKGPWTPLRPEYLRPLPIFSYALDYKIFKTNFIGIHISHLFYYMLMLILMFKCVYIFSKNKFISFSTICLFLINPINSIHPMIITQRTDVLAMIFISGSFLLLMNKKYSASVLLYVFSLLSKEATGLIYIPFCAGLIFFTSKFKKYKSDNIKYFITISILSCFYLAYIMYLPLAESNHKYSLAAYFVANLNLITSLESIFKAEKTYYFFILPILMMILFLINRRRPSMKRLLAMLFAMTIVFGMSSRIRLLIFPSILLCYYLSIILNQCFTKVLVDFSRYNKYGNSKQSKHHIQIAVICIISLIWLDLTILDKKSYQVNTIYHKYANFVHYKNGKNDIPVENLSAFKSYIDGQNMNSAERDIFVKKWLDRNSFCSVKREFDQHSIYHCQQMLEIARTSKKLFLSVQTLLKLFWESLGKVRKVKYL